MGRAPGTQKNLHQLSEKFCLGDTSHLGETPEKKGSLTQAEVVVITVTMFSLILLAYLLKCWSNLYFFIKVSVDDHLLFTKPLKTF